MAAELTAANVPDPDKALALLHELPPEVRFILGDTLYNDPVLRTACEQHCRILVATRRGRYPHSEPGVEVRKIFHRLRSAAIEPFNGLFKDIFEYDGQMPVKGLKRTQLIVIGAVFLY